MEPIPETLEAIAELDPSVDDGQLLDQLRERAARARQIAPDCVGVSVASREQGLTFTLVASTEVTAALDAVQYLDGGPCVDGATTGQGVATTEQDLLDESRWQVFGRATASQGVRSTLTFPVMRQGEAVGSVNLYGSTPDTFDGTHEELAAVFDAWAPGAVTNADLSFSTREVAARAPQQVRDQARVDVATGIFAALAHVDLSRAAELLHDAARRAGVPVARLADVIIDLRST